ncbi:hypothetical protein GPK64_07790 [Coprococcus eutactus]|nr:hypothetical protein [Coprococcus eutactus]
MSGSNLLSSVASFFASHKLLANLLILLDYTSFLTSGVSALKVVIIAVGGGLAVLGVVNLLEGYGNDNPGANAHVRQRSTKQNKDSQPCHYSEVRGTQ